MMSQDVHLARGTFGRAKGGLYREAPTGVMRRPVAAGRRGCAWRRADRPRPTGTGRS
jgi:hypothetical protein